MSQLTKEEIELIAENEELRSTLTALVESVGYFIDSCIQWADNGTLFFEVGAEEFYKLNAVVQKIKEGKE